MAFALTRFNAYGVQSDEPLSKRYIQRVEIKATAANTDTDFDLGDATGTFWDAVDATDIGANGLKCMKTISSRSVAWLGIWGTGVSAYTRTPVTLAATVGAILSSAAAGGSATETMTVTGILTTDTVLGVTQAVDGAGAAVGILAYGNASGNAAANDALSVTWNADPGAGAKVKVSYLRAGAASVTPTTGSYILTVDVLGPNLLFLSGNAPTAYDVVLEWELANGQPPVTYFQSA